MDTPAPHTPLRLLRLRDVCVRVGLGRSQVYQLQRAGEFPAAVRLHGRAVAWRSDEIDGWIAARPRAGRTTENTNAPAGTGASIAQPGT